MTQAFLNVLTLNASQQGLGLFQNFQDQFQQFQQAGAEASQSLAEYLPFIFGGAAAVAATAATAWILLRRLNAGRSEAVNRLFEGRANDAVLSISANSVEAAIQDLSETLATVSEEGKRRMIEDGIAAYQDLKPLIAMKEGSKVRVDAATRKNPGALYEKISERLRPLLDYQAVKAEQYFQRGVLADPEVDPDAAAAVNAASQGARRAGEGLHVQAALQAWNSLPSDARKALWEMEEERDAAPPAVFLKTYVQAVSDLLAATDRKDPKELSFSNTAQFLSILEPYFSKRLIANCAEETAPFYLRDFEDGEIVLRRTGEERRGRIEIVREGKRLKIRFTDRGSDVATTYRVREILTTRPAKEDLTGNWTTAPAVAQVRDRSVLKSASFDGVSTFVDFSDPRLIRFLETKIRPIRDSFHTNKMHDRLAAVGVFEAVKALEPAPGGEPARRGRNYEHLFDLIESGAVKERGILLQIALQYAGLRSRLESRVIDGARRYWTRFYSPSTSEEFLFDPLKATLIDVKRNPDPEYRDESSAPKPLPGEADPDATPIPGALPDPPDDEDDTEFLADPKTFITKEAVIAELREAFRYLRQEPEEETHLSFTSMIAADVLEIWEERGRPHEIWKGIPVVPEQILLDGVQSVINHFENRARTVSDVDQRDWPGQLVDGLRTTYLGSRAEREAKAVSNEAVSNETDEIDEDQRPTTVPSKPPINEHLTEARRSTPPPPPQPAAGLRPPGVPPPLPPEMQAQGPLRDDQIRARELAAEAKRGISQELRVRYAELALPERAAIVEGLAEEIYDCWMQSVGPGVMIGPGVVPIVPEPTLEKGVADLISNLKARGTDRHIALARKIDASDRGNRDRRRNWHEAEVAWNALVARALTDIAIEIRERWEALNDPKFDQIVDALIHKIFDAWKPPELNPPEEGYLIAAPEEIVEDAVDELLANLEGRGRTELARAIRQSDEGSREERAIVATVIEDNDSAIEGVEDLASSLPPPPKVPQIDVPLAEAITEDTILSELKVRYPVLAQAEYRQIAIVTASEVNQAWFSAGSPVETGVLSGGPMVAESLIEKEIKALLSSLEARGGPKHRALAEGIRKGDRGRRATRELGVPHATPSAPPPTDTSFVSTIAVPVSAGTIAQELLQRFPNLQGTHRRPLANALAEEILSAWSAEGRPFEFKGPGLKGLVPERFVEDGLQALRERLESRDSPSARTLLNELQENDKGLRAERDMEALENQIRESFRRQAPDRSA